MKHISSEYDKELESLQSHLTALGGLAEQQLMNAMKAFVNSDSALGEQVRETELHINHNAIELDRAVTNVIAKRQPTARDLRLIMSILKNSTDIERIGDESERIAKLSSQMTSYEPNLSYHGDLTDLFSRVSDAVKQALDVFARLDEVTAVARIAADREIDGYYNAVVQAATNEMTKNQSGVNDYLSVIWVARSLERIGDHAKNICESVVYVESGHPFVRNV